MRVALITSVVALVAVSQPFGFEYPAQPFQSCNMIGRDMQCCFPEVFGGCSSIPGMFPPGRTPPGYLPDPRFLSAVCCPSGRECCPRDQDARQPVYTCCGTSQSCNIVNKMGTCIDGAAGNGTTPDDVEELDTAGRCPHDGNVPITIAPGQAFRCSLNTFINGFDCPSGTECVRDRSGNVNAGVCCRKSGCELNTNCTSCVQNAGRVNFPCGWLAQGNLDDPNPRCVADCYNFPDKSCIRPSDGRLCPRSDDNPNGTVVNTGSCDRRCGLVGTGRSDRITNNGNVQPTKVNVTKTNCCTRFAGDYCCSAYGTLAAHCAFGQVAGGPLCGVPIRGTPNNFYNNEVAGGNPYFQPYGGFGGSPYGNLYGSPYGGFGGFGPQFYPQVPSPYFNPFLNPYGRDSGLTNKEIDEKQLYYAPAPVFYPPTAPINPYNPYTPFAPGTPAISTQQPTLFVCSCDSACTEQDDCCSDFVSECVQVATTTAPVTTSAPGTTPTP